MTVTKRDGCIGLVKGSGENEFFHARANFTLEIIAKVEGAKDGYIARVTRSPDNVSRYMRVVVCCKDVMCVVQYSIHY